MSFAPSRYRGIGDPGTFVMMVLERGFNKREAFNLVNALVKNAKVIGGKSSSNFSKAIVRL